MRDIADLIVSLLIRWLAPASPWPLRLRDHWFWIDGLAKGLILGAAWIAICGAIGVLVGLAAGFVRQRNRQKDRR